MPEVIVWRDVVTVKDYFGTNALVYVTTVWELINGRYVRTKKEEGIA